MNSNCLRWKAIQWRINRLSIAEDRVPKKAKRRSNQGLMSLLKGETLLCSRIVWRIRLVSSTLILKLLSCPNSDELRYSRLHLYKPTCFSSWNQILSQLKKFLWSPGEDLPSKIFKLRCNRQPLTQTKNTGCYSCSLSMRRLQSWVKTNSVIKCLRTPHTSKRKIFTKISPNVCGRFAQWWNRISSDKWMFEINNH